MYKPGGGKTLYNNGDRRNQLPLPRRPSAYGFSNEITIVPVTKRRWVGQSTLLRATASDRYHRAVDETVIIIITTRKAPRPARAAPR